MSEEEWNLGISGLDSPGSRNEGNGGQKLQLFAVIMLSLQCISGPCH